MGDFNQWDVPSALEDFLDMAEADVGPTRGNNSIDKIFTNFPRSLVESGSLPPPETDGGEEGTKKSDHRVAYVGANLPNNGPGKLIKYTYRYYEKASIEPFKAWTMSQDWAAVYSATESNEKSLAYQKIVDQGLDQFFPWKTTIRRSNDSPWINAAIKNIQGRAVLRSGRE